MKVVTPKVMAALEQKAYQAGHKEEEFMEKAGKGIAQATAKFVEDLGLDSQVTLLCGKGNNTGDAYVAGRYLLEIGYRVHAIQIVDIEKAGQLCKENHDRFLEEGGKVDTEPYFPETGVILDGLFGTGFHGTLGEPFSSLVEKANLSGLPIVAIDIPSGLNGETGEVEGTAIKAALTVSLGLPKKGFFFNDGWDYVGKLAYADFGLPETLITEAASTLRIKEPKTIIHALPKMEASRHKYQAGVVAIWAGSPGMPGAALLAGSAALRSGAGLVRLLHPHGMECELSSSLYELIKVGYDYHDPDAILSHLNKANSSCIGPGIGRQDEMRKLLKDLLPKIEKPCVIDADALTLIAEEGCAFPKSTIITPHKGEMKRLLGGEEVTLERCQEYVNLHQVTLVLKGGPTFLLFPNESNQYINPHGDPGMATAGTGDVLSGMIAAFLAEGLSLREAAFLGVYLHSLAGEEAAKKKTSTCMIASDIIEALPLIFQSQVALQPPLEQKDSHHP
ncbi:MAG: NAD(P)H-hydrate dehydratase [Waddliaceae bacterium]